MVARVTAIRGVRGPTPGRADAPPGGMDHVVAPLPSSINSLALIAAKVAAMGLGFLFWLVAARVAAPAEVGLAAGAVSAMMLCTQVAILGFGSAVITHVRRYQERLPVLFNSAITLVVAASLVLSLLFVLLAGRLFNELNAVAHSWLFGSLFVAAAVFGTLGILLDQTGTALRRGDHALIRNLAFGLGTLAGLLTIAAVSSDVSAPTLLAPWALAGALATVLGIWQLARSVTGFRPRVLVDRPLSLRLVRSALPNYLLTLTERVPGLVLPILVTELLSPSANATWYGVWMMAWVVYIVPIQVGLTVFSEISDDRQAQARALRRGLRSSLGFGLVLATGAALLAEPLLGLLGRHYASGGVAPLRILVLAWIPLTFTQCYFASARARGRLGEAITTGVITAVVSTTVTVVAGMLGGLTAMAVGWLGAQTAAGMWAALRLANPAAEPVTEDAVETRPRHEKRRPQSGPDRARAVLRNAAPLGPWVLPPVALTVAWLALREASLSDITDVGLVSVLPAGYFVALAIVATSFTLALRGQERTPLLVFQFVVAIVLLFGTTIFYEQVPRFHVVYRHAGVIDHLLAGGPIDARIDAYFNWPGFFILVKNLTALAGLPSPLPIASYAPPLFNLLALPALVVIAKRATPDWRIAWIGVWIFYLSNWIGQDYLAPQAYAFILYLAVAVALLTTLASRVAVPRRRLRRRSAAVLSRVGHWAGARPPLREVPQPKVGHLERAGIVVACTAIVAAMVASHQLTPFACLLVMVSLVLARRTTASALPLITAVLLSAWLSYMAAEYLHGHLRGLVGDLLSAGGSVSANVGDRVAGSSGHLLVVYLRIGATALLWTAGAFGYLRMVRHGRAASSHAILAFSPLVLVPLQPYGGEVLLRAYLFALPFVSVLAAWALFPEVAGRWPWRRSAALLMSTCVLMGTFLFTRYGNERATLYTAQERQAMLYVYSVASRGDSIAAGNVNVPWEDQGYRDYHFILTRQHVPPPATPEAPRHFADRVAAALQAESPGRRAYLVITRSQLIYDEMIGAPQWAFASALQEGALQSPRFALVYTNPDAKVFAVTESR